MNHTPLTNDTTKDKKASDAAGNDSAGTKEPATSSTPPATAAAERRWRWLMLTAAVLVIGAAAYTAYAWRSGGGTASTVNVTLKEWSVTFDAPSVPAGLVKFQVRNNGPNDTHEFVVVKTNLAPEQLPVDVNGAVDENGAGIEIIGEIEDIPAGPDTRAATFDLAPGRYVLICNIWDAGERESHYHQGMRAAFTVR